MTLCLESLSYFEEDKSMSLNTFNKMFLLVDDYGEDIQYTLGQSLSIIATKNSIIIL